MKPLRVVPAWLAIALACLLPASVRAESLVVLRVYAAASLSGAFGDLGARFERLHPGVRVQFNFAGSQQLAAQLDQGAAADVFASADERWMAHAAAAGLVADEPVTFASNRLVVIVPRTNPARIRTLPDLARGGVKLVIGADAVPVGRYARTLLAQLGAQPGYPPGFARRALANVVSEEENVKSVVGKVQLGEADAGVVYRSDVTPSVARYVAVLEPPPAANVIAAYPVAVLRGAGRAAEAHAFVELVRSVEGRAVLAHWGFGAPGAAAH